MACLTYFKLYLSHKFKSCSSIIDSQTVDETEESSVWPVTGREKDILEVAADLQQLNFYSIDKSDNLL